MIAKGYIAMCSGLVLLGGHLLIFVLVWGNVNISPASKGDIVGLIVPVTVASLISAAMYSIKYSDVPLGDTPKGNYFFVTFAILVPLIFVGIMVSGVRGLGNDRDVESFKHYVVAAEGTFGAVFSIVTGALFEGAAKAAPKKSQRSGNS